MKRTPDPLAPPPQQGGPDWFSFWFYAGLLGLIIIGGVVYALVQSD